MFPACDGSKSAQAAAREIERCSRGAKNHQTANAFKLNLVENTLRYGTLERQNSLAHGWWFALETDASAMPSVAKTGTKKSVD